MGLSSLHRVWQYLQGIAQKVSWKGKHREGRFLCSVAAFWTLMNQQASGKSFGQGREKGLAYFSLLSELKVVAGQMETSSSSSARLEGKGCPAASH